MYNALRHGTSVTGICAQGRLATSGSQSSRYNTLPLTCRSSQWAKESRIDRDRVAKPYSNLLSAVNGKESTGWASVYQGVSSSLPFPQVLPNYPIDPAPDEPSHWYVRFSGDSFERGHLLRRQIEIRPDFSWHGPQIICRVGLRSISGAFR